MSDEIEVTREAGPEGGGDVLRVKIGESDWFTVSECAVPMLIARLQEAVELEVTN